MMILSACYTCAGRGPLIEVDHAVPVQCSGIEDYIRTVQLDREADNLLAGVWPLFKVPSCWSLLTIEGRGPGYLMCWIERPHMTFYWEILRHASDHQKGVTDGPVK